LATTFKRSERSALITNIERDAMTLATTAADTLRNDPTATSIPALVSLVQAGKIPADERIVVVRKDGPSSGPAIFDTADLNQSGTPAQLSTNFATDGRGEIQQAFDGRHAIGTRHSNDLGTDLLYVAVPVWSNGRVLGATRITFPTKFVDARVQRVWILLAALSAFVLAVATLVGLRFARSIAGPLARLERASVAAGEGDLSVRAPVAGPAEVQSLATRFNQMVGRLEDLIREREAFIADASHQLRTPLAAMRLRLENLEADASGTDQSNLEAAVAEVDRLNRMVDGLLVLSRPTSNDGIELIDVEELVAERVQLWAALCEEQGIAINGEMVVEQADSPRLTISAVAGRLEQVIDNLIENALEATPHGSVSVRAARHGKSGVEIHVVDTGRGMNDQERNRAFDRFWRSERNPTDGTGLGLAIVRRLVEADNGTITLHEAPSGGLDVLIRYPGATATDGEPHTGKRPMPSSPDSREPTA
jgi:signal transduction histidine kinase